MAEVDYRGQWTLLTGASSGIGAAFARRLAARGSNLVLVARRRDRLEALASAIRREHDVRIEPLVADLSVSGGGRAVAAEVTDRGLPVTSLINNAGAITYGPLHEADLDRLTLEIALGVSAVVELTHAFLPALRDAGRGVLVNVASMAAYGADPYLAVYAAAKAFVLSLTESVWYESRGTGLRVLAVSPGPTRTEFLDAVSNAEHIYKGLPFATPDQVARETLTALDRRNAPPSLPIGRANRAFVRLNTVISRRAFTEFVGRKTRPRR